MPETLNDDIELENAKRVGKKVRDRREKQRMSRPTLAEQLGVHPNRLAQLEDGFARRYAKNTRGGTYTIRPTRFTRDMLLELCNVLRFEPDSVNEILTLSGYPSLDETREIVYLHDLPPEERDRILAIADKYTRRQRPD